LIGAGGSIAPNVKIAWTYIHTTARAE